MALDRKAVMVRLSDEAYDALRLVAEFEEKDLGEKGREIIERDLLGAVHSLTLQATRFARLTKSASGRKGKQSDPSGSLDFDSGKGGT